MPDLARDLGDDLEAWNEEFDGAARCPDAVGEGVDGRCDRAVDAVARAKLVYPVADDLDARVEGRQEVAADARLELGDVLAEASEFACGGVGERAALAGEAGLYLGDDLRLRGLRVEGLRLGEGRLIGVELGPGELDAGGGRGRMLLPKLRDIGRDLRDDDPEAAERSVGSLLRSSEEGRSLPELDVSASRDVLGDPEVLERDRRVLRAGLEADERVADLAEGEAGVPRLLREDRADGLAVDDPGGVRVLDRLPDGRERDLFGLGGRDDGLDRLLGPADREEAPDDLPDPGEGTPDPGGRLGLEGREVRPDPDECAADLAGYVVASFGLGGGVRFRFCFGPAPAPACGICAAAMSRATPRFSLGVGVRRPGAVRRSAGSSSSSRSNFASSRSSRPFARAAYAVLRSRRSGIVARPSPPASVTRPSSSL